MMKLMSLKQYMNMSKPALIRKIMKTLKAMPKKRLAVVCYNITKSKLPRLRTIKRKALPDPTGMGWTVKAARKRISKKKRKFSRKQLAAQRLFAKRARAGTLRKRRRRRTSYH